MKTVSNKRLLERALGILEMYETAERRQAAHDKDIELYAFHGYSFVDFYKKRIEKMEEIKERLERSYKETLNKLSVINGTTND
jgi:hypothetical protein